MTEPLDSTNDVLNIREQDQSRSYVFTSEQQQVVDAFRTATTVATASRPSLSTLRSLSSGVDDFVKLLPHHDGKANPDYEPESIVSSTPFIREQFQDGQVLDIGAGGIELRGVLPTQQVTYADIIPADQIQGITPEEAEKYVEADASKLPFPDASFDGIFTSNFLSEENVEAYLHEMLRVLKEGGVLMIKPMGNDETLRRIMGFLPTVGIDPKQGKLSYSQRRLRHKTEEQLTMITNPEIFLSVRK